jgi:hypothetical protein
VQDQAAFLKDNPDLAKAVGYVVRKNKLFSCRSNMNLFELSTDGELTRDMIREYGEVLTFKERILDKNYGLAHLKLQQGPKEMMAFYEQENNTIRTHFDWVKKGAIIRMRTMRNIYAIGLRDDQIENIIITKKPDYIYAMPLFPFWILLKLGTPISIAKWFMIDNDKFNTGPAYIEINLTDNQKLIYELEGGLWAGCLATFGIKRIKQKVNVIDERKFK